MNGKCYNHTITKDGKTFHSNLWKWILSGWELMPQIKQSLKKTGLSCVLDGSEEYTAHISNSEDNNDSGYDDSKDQCSI